MSHKRRFRKLNNTIPPRKKRQGLTTEELKAIKDTAEPKNKSEDAISAEEAQGYD